VHSGKFKDWQTCGAADVTAQIEEKLILATLSDLSICAGHYSAASRKEVYFGKENTHAMLDYGSRNVTMHRFFDRVHAEALTSDLQTKYTLQELTLAVLQMGALRIQMA
jgi:hypothetical protein